jgi:hypothetical protein
MNKESIPGWGYDLLPEDRPAYPMWHRQEDTGSHYTEETIPRQKMKYPVLKSIEYPELTPVFSQKVPPTGLSGLIRKFAFRYSEGSFGHWMPLLFADRVNMMEGLVEDVLHLRVPNIWKEMGLNSEWKYNRKSFVKKTTVTTVVLAGAVGSFLLLKQNKFRTTTRARN